VEALGLATGAETLGRLQPRGFVEAQPESRFQGDTEWSFHHNLLQEVTYESVLKRERAALHRVAAGWLERQARHAGRLDEFAGLLGDHCERAGDLSAAADWYLCAGRQAMGQGAPREARGFYTQALELLPPVDRERRWQALLGREEALGVLAEAELGKADLAALLDLARAFDDDNRLAEASLRQAMFGMRTGERNLIEEGSREALAAARRCGDEATEIKALAITASVELHWGTRSATIERIEEALCRARRLGEEGVLAYVLSRASFYYNELGDLATCYPLQVEQVELDHRLGNRSQEAQGLGNLGSTYLVMGLYKQARLLIEQASGISRALGARRLLAFDLMNLAEICCETGDLRRARQLLEESLQEFSPSQDARGTVFALEDLGYVLLTMGDAPGAVRRFTEARDLARSHEQTAQISQCTAGLAACAVMQGQLDEARRDVCESWDYLREHGWVGMGNPGIVYRLCAETFDALGEPELARAVIESAHQELVNMADRINVPDWRQSFLENVPEHQALMEMWERTKL
jgi:tetratricopeptide (TPR) repeat protein